MPINGVNIPGKGRVIVFKFMTAIRFRIQPNAPPCQVSTAHRIRMHTAPALPGTDSLPDQDAHSTRLAKYR